MSPSAVDVPFAFAPLQPVAAPTPADDPRALVDAARAEAALVREQARAEGFDLGRQEARDAVQPALAALGEAARQAQELAAGTASRLEADAVELAFAVAEKILAAHLEADRGLVLETVRGALRGLVEREHVTVLVHPDDLDLVRAGGDDLRAELGGIERWDVQAERRVGRGGAILRHGDGQVDARLETKLERAREVVLEQLSGGAGA